MRRLLDRRFWYHYLWRIPVLQLIPRTHWSSYGETQEDGEDVPTFVIWKQWLGRCYQCFYIYPDRAIVGKQSWRRAGP